MHFCSERFISVEIIPTHYREEFSLLGYNVVQSVEIQPTFEYRTSETKNLRKGSGNQSGLFFDPENGGDIILQNFG
jgi:hypothetical protein